jgi:hypothetical protein
MPVPVAAVPVAVGVGVKLTAVVPGVVKAGLVEMLLASMPVLREDTTGRAVLWAP